MQRRQFLLTAASTIGASIAPGALLPAWAADTTRTLKFIPQADLAILDPIGTTA
jgi:peptide/nickel transport system substrate-binding protein